jgi:hypothetical protein
MGLIHRLISAADPAAIGSAILPILQLEPAALSAQKKMLRFATMYPPGDHTWADDIFESIWMNQTHAQNLEAFKKR